MLFIIFVQNVCSELCFLGDLVLVRLRRLSPVAVGSQKSQFQWTQLVGVLSDFLFRILVFRRLSSCEILETRFQWTPLAENLSEHFVQIFCSEFLFRFFVQNFGFRETRFL